MSARKGKTPVELAAEKAASEAVREAVPSILAAVAREVAAAVGPAVVKAVQAEIQRAILEAVKGAGGDAGGGPVVSFGPPPVPLVHRPEPTGVQGQRPADPNSPEGRAWLAESLRRSGPPPDAPVQRDERVPIRTGNLAIDRMLSGGVRVAPRESDFA